LSTAIPLSFDGSQPVQWSGTLTDPNQVDLYRVQLQGGALISAAVVAYRPDNPLDSALRFFDNHGNQLAFNDNHHGLDPRLEVTVPADGVYYFGVSSADDFSYDPTTAGTGSQGNSTGSYTLSISPAHDTLTTAIPLDYYSYIYANGTLSDPDQVDLYQVQLSAGQAVIAQAQAWVWLESPVDTVLRIFDASGRQLAFNHNGPDSLIEFIPPADGTYYMGVSSAEDFSYDPLTPGSGSGGNSTGLYTLTLTAAHDTFATAIPLDLSFGTTGGGGTLTNPNQVDLYQVQLRVGETVVAQVQASGGDTGLRIFDATGEQVAFNDNGNGMDRLEFTPVADGAYYLGISSADNFSYDPLTPASGSGGTSTPNYSFTLTLAHDTLSTAIPLTYDGSQPAYGYGNLTNPNQVDLYQLQLTSGETIVARLPGVYPWNPLDLGLRIFDASGKQLAFRSDSVRSDLTIEFNPTADGTYYLGVSCADNFGYDPLTPGTGSGGNSTGYYTLTITPAHDTLATAIPSAYSGYQNSFLYGNLNDPNQVDMYQLQLTAGEAVIVQVPGFLLRIFDANGNQLALNDDNQGPNPGLLFTAPTDGSYYVGVSSSGNFAYDPLTPGSGSGGSSTGFYDLILTPLHDTLATAVPVGSLFSTTLVDPNQVDLYQVPLNAGDEIVAAVQAYSLNNPLDSALRLFDASGHQLAFNDNWTGPDPRLAFIAPASGLYYLGVSSADNFAYDPLTSRSGSGGTSVGNYTLTVSPAHDVLATASPLTYDGTHQAKRAEISPTRTRSISISCN
jgi:hypothetical protein